MNWDDLKIFLYVSRRKTLAKAAQELKLDETTISRRLKRLEQNLGQTLFERLRSGHTLTSHGEALLTKAEAIERETDDISRVKVKGVRKPSGTLRISVSEGFGAYVLAPVLQEFNSAYPDIEIDLVSGSGFLSLSKRETDIAIGLSRPKSKYISSELLSEYKLHLYGSPNYLDNYDPISQIGDLMHHALIGYVDDLAYSDKLRYFHEKLPNLRPQIRSTSIIAQMRLVTNGTGLAILPDFMAEGHLIGVLKKELEIKRQFWFSAHQSVASTGRVKAFKEFSMSTLKSALSS